MRTLRNSTSQADPNPQVADSLSANTRKLSNPSGTGCVITEAPAGLAISVPTTDKGFWAIIGGNPNILPSATASQPNLSAFVTPPTQASYTDLQTEDHRYYQWQAAYWTIPSQYFPGDTLLETATQTGDASTQNASAAYPMQGYSTKYIILNRAREINDNPVPPGAFVWMTKGSLYTAKVTFPGSGGGYAGNQTIVCQEYVFSYAPRPITFQLWENLWMLPQAGMAPNLSGSQPPGCALAYEVADGTPGPGSELSYTPQDYTGTNHDQSKLIVVFDPAYLFGNAALPQRQPRFIGLGAGYIATPGSSNTPEWSVPDEGWAVYWGDFPYGGITRSDGVQRLFPWYLIVHCRTPYLHAQCGGGSTTDGDLGPGAENLHIADASLTGDDNPVEAALAGTLYLSDSNNTLTQWYESKQGWAFRGHWSLEESGVGPTRHNTWTIDAMDATIEGPDGNLPVTAKTFAATVTTTTAGATPVAVSILSPLDGAALVAASVTSVGNHGAFNASDAGNNLQSTGDRVTIRQTGAGSSLTDPDAWEIIAVERFGLTQNISWGINTYYFVNGLFVSINHVPGA
jgi:hypothetical protein